MKLKQKRGKKGAKHFSMADITDEDVERALLAMENDTAEELLEGMF